MTIREGWTEKPLREILLSRNVKSKQIQSSQYQNVGTFPVVDQSSNFICGYHDDDRLVIFEGLPFTVFGDHTRHTKYVTFPFIAGADGTQVLKPARNIDEKFFFYLVSRAAEKIGSFGYDRHFKHLKEFIAQYPIARQEQIQIAKTLSVIDKAIEQTEAIIAKQQRIKTGLMQDLLTRGIDEHGNIRSEESNAFKESALGLIPTEWEIARLGAVATRITSGSRGWARYYANEGSVFLRIGNLTREHIDLRLDDTIYVCPPASAEGSRTSVEEGDLLISITADLGIVGVIPFGFGEAYINQHIALIRLNKDEIDPRYVGYAFAGNAGQEQFKKLNESGAKAGLNLPTVEKLIFCKPGREEQSRIAAVLDKHTETVRQQHFHLTKLRRQKAALMQDLLTGKVRVTPLLEAGA
ncbi:MAG: restriction endonuclease subunit S [Lamprocystis purpurea]|jgi:type I restriction enzyme S subunit|uniref:restriction endonuclease subunit S n=1 Tax=Lamprocystis purpurea TaxID=61598 RepID=UPI0003A430C7|nr:restriction endonuclease subunit S [Lamprocystis purpurea]MBV5274095.1 restriction endonuclease subunit S [Lamprocystis purpurea]